jgi:hypothetical protein
MLEADYSLYLRVGDRVFHKRFLRWGVGAVVEERRSELPGGFCYVRIEFQDGKMRVFDNNFKSSNCCYYAGVEKIDTERLVRRTKREEDRIKKRIIKLLMRTRKMLKASNQAERVGRATHSTGEPYTDR